jgi:hypothetical protein
MQGRNKFMKELNMLLGACITGKTLFIGGDPHRLDMQFSNRARVRKAVQKSAWNPWN